MDCNSNLFLSLIISVRNKTELLEKLLRSIADSNYLNYELIIIDDASKENVKSIASKYKTVYFRLKQKRGAGAARNLGAEKAKGNILVFIDSDTEVFPNTFSELVKPFQNPKTNAVIGVYDKIPANKGTFPAFKALRDYSYIMLERDPNYPIGGFGGWISAIRKNIFWEIGGFDQSYKGAGMEDYEFAWRLIKKTEIIFNPKIKIKHNFNGFWVTCLNFYKRSSLWIEMYLKYKRFFSSATNPREGLIAGLSNLTIFFLLLFLIVKSIQLFILFLVVFSIRLYLGRIFLLFALKEKGIFFMVYSIMISSFLYLAVYAGVLAGIIRSFIKLKLFN